MPIHGPRIPMIPSSGVESGCQLVPEASRDMPYGPYSPAMDMASAEVCGETSCAALVTGAELVTKAIMRSQPGAARCMTRRRTGGIGTLMDGCVW